MKKVMIPKFVDDPPSVLLWSIDEIAPLALGLVMGMIIGRALIFTVLGLVVTHLYRRHVNQNQDGFLCHWLYWHGFYFKESRTVVNPFSRIWY